MVRKFTNVIRSSVNPAFLRLLMLINDKNGSFRSQRDLFK